MLHETITLPLHYDKKLNNSQTPKLTTYFLDNFEALDENRKRAVVLICPGGGYEHLSVREGEAIAIKMMSLGFHAAVLSYSLEPMAFPASLCDLAEAVHFLRSNSTKFNIDSNKIIVAGFSAGSHLASSLGCYWNSSFLSDYIPYKSEEIKPNVLLLSYPVITADERFCHPGSIQKVLGKTNSFDRDFVSIEKHVTKDFPPTFMWHTLEDQAVPAENSLLMANALRKAGVEFEYHLFSRGKHGLALATKETSKTDGSTVENECSIWPELFKNWYEVKGIF